MEILGIGPLEFLVIVVIALIIFSPKDLAKGGKEIGRWINRLYRSDAWKSMRQVSQEMQNLPSRLAREAQLDDLKELEKDIHKAEDAQLAGLKEMEKDIRLEAGSPYRDPPSVPQMPPARSGVVTRADAPEQPESKPDASPGKEDSGEG
ncbi:MAG: twin-arginine translocase TatA/TatE family subunit [Anaerolineales bacterium]|nr:twin-arginine translocase TatA/TatE family subunit [Anaerolineales bacterium]